MAQLDHLHETINVKRLRKKNQIVFHYDNVRPHSITRCRASCDQYHRQ